MKHAITLLIALVGVCISAPAQPSTVPRGAGLRGTYYNGMNFEEKVLTRLDVAIDFDWRKEPPAPGMGAERFSVRWEGWLLVPETGEYEFSTVMDDGLRFWLGRRRLIDAWRDQDHVPATVRLRLEAGRYYPLRVEYFQNRWDTRALLQWRRVDGPAEFQPVGPEHLFAALPATARPVPPPAAARPEPPPAVAAAQPRPARPAPAKAAAPPARPRPVAPPAQRPVTPPPAATPSVAQVAAPDTLPGLATLTRGQALALRHLYFVQGQARLLPSSEPELNRLAQQLRAEATRAFEIAGHTDNVGDARLNQQLSEQRARVVRQYLVRHGVDSGRLTAVGYGGTRPVADNQDPRQRPHNRRVELVAR